MWAFMACFGDCDLRVVAADHEEGSADHLDVADRAARRPGSCCHSGQHDFANVLERGNGMDAQTRAVLTGEARHVRVHGREVDRDLGMVDRPGVEQGVHEREPVVLRLECGPSSRLEGLEHRLDAQDVVAQARAGRSVPISGVPAFHVAAHLRAQAQLEASARELLEVPCELGGDERAAREGDRDVGAELHALGVLGGDGERQVRVVAGLRNGHAVEAQALGVAGCIGDPADADRRLRAAGVLIVLGAQQHGLHSKRHVATTPLLRTGGGRREPTTAVGNPDQVVRARGCR